MKGNGRRARAHFILHPACCSLLILCLLIADGASAFNNLSVERRTIRDGEQVTITVSLEDEFAELDDVRVPVHNLRITDPPSVASEFSWINGTIVRRKVLRYRARAVGPGSAVVGPLVLRVGSQRDTLPAITVNVLPDRAASSSDPEVILRELLATGREPLFVAAEQEAKSTHVGEQIVVTWFLYNASTVQQWQIGSIPKLSDFWVEELEVRTTGATTVLVGGYTVQKMPVRAVALYPLRAGRLEVGPMEIEAAVLRRANRRRFSLFEGNLVEVAFASAPLWVDAAPLPPGPAVSAIGDLRLRCTQPSQKNGGPVVVDALLSGRGNLRAASPPAFASQPAGEVERIERGVAVQRTGGAPTMSRQWQYVIFPRQGGSLAIPPLQIPVFSTAADERQLLQCPASTLAVTAAERPPLAIGPLPVTQPSIGSRAAPFVIAAAIGMACLVFVLPWWRRRSNLQSLVQRIMADETPSAVRDGVHAALEVRGIDPLTLLREGSDRGDAYRSLRSLLDALERDRIEVDDSSREIRRRIRELLLA